MVKENEIKLGGFEYVGSELSFIVRKDIWKESIFPIRWTSTKPTKFISFIPNGTVFLFLEIVKIDDVDIIRFLGITPGTDSIIDPIELSIEELDYLLKEEHLKFTDNKDVKEISITTLGTLIQDIKGWTYNHPIYLPSDIYIIMGENEFKNSAGKVRIGQKVKLPHILDVYSKSIK